MHWYRYHPKYIFSKFYTEFINKGKKEKRKKGRKKYIMREILNGRKRTCMYVLSCMHKQFPEKIL